MQEDTVNDSFEHLVANAICIAACSDVGLVTEFAQRVAHLLYGSPQRVGSREVETYDE